MRAPRSRAAHVPASVALRLLPLLASPVLATCGEAPEQPPNVLLVSIDTLRADHLGCYGYGRPTSPCLDSLARDGVLFEDSFSASSWTLPSHASLLTSRRPSGHGAQQRDQRLGKGVRTLAQVLRRRGYTTAGFTTWIYVSERFGLDRGFQTFEYIVPPTPRGPGDLAQPAAPAEDVVARVEEWLATSPAEPWFLFLHFIDPHMEYEPPLEVARLFDPELESVRGGDYAPLDPYLRRIGREALPVPPDVLAEAVALYDGEIRYTDSEIARVLEVLGGLEDSLVVVTADHGEEFSEHDALMSHGLTLYDEMLRVPLILRLPERAFAGRRPAALARSIDVAPTILELCGQPVPGDFEGRSLLPAIASDAADESVYAFSSSLYAGAALWSVRSATHKLVLDKGFLGADPSAASFELYDLVADPGETRNLWDPDDPVARELRGALEKWMSGGRPPAPGEPVRLSEEELRRLEALGYVSGDE